MAAVQWDPEQYRLFAEFRGRAFVDLVARIRADHPRRVVDLGAGPGELTASLVERWPEATIEATDSSPEMIAEAAKQPGITARLQSIQDFRPASDTDVLVSNAALQWVPNHRQLLDQWMELLPAGAWLAFQVPGNFGSATHTLLREVAGRPRWGGSASAALRVDAVDDPSAYAERLVRAGWSSDVWETTYLHALPGESAVLEWMRGTGLRPVLQALPEHDRDAFEAEYRAALDEAYPRINGVTLMPFRRIFVVGQRIN